MVFLYNLSRVEIKMFSSNQRAGDVGLQFGEVSYCACLLKSSATQNGSKNVFEEKEEVEAAGVIKLPWGIP